MTKKLAIKLLAFAERVYLFAHGWRSLPTDSVHGLYVPPDDYPFRRHETYVRVHAVNAQRQWYARVTVEKRERE